MNQPVKPKQTLTLFENSSRTTEKMLGVRYISASR